MDQERKTKLSVYNRELQEGFNKIITCGVFFLIFSKKRHKQILISFWFKTWVHVQSGKQFAIFQNALLDSLVKAMGTDLQISIKPY